MKLQVTFTVDVYSTEFYDTPTPPPGSNAETVEREVGMAIADALHSVAGLEGGLRMLCDSPIVAKIIR